MRTEYQDYTNHPQFLSQRNYLVIRWVGSLVFLLSLFGGAKFQPLLADGENLMVVVNAASADSLAVANEYILLRDIPGSNVVYLDEVTIIERIDDETTNSANFKKEIIDPVLAAIESRGLAGRINCIVYSTGFPTRVNVHAEMLKYLKNMDLEYNIQRHAPWCSITSLTFFNENAFSSNPEFFNFKANRYASPETKNVLSNPFSGTTAAEFGAAVNSFNENDYSEAITLFDQLADEFPEQAVIHYYLAKCHAEQGDSDAAAASLDRCIQLGWAFRSFVKSDPSFENVIEETPVKKCLQKMLDLPTDQRQSRHFQSNDYWGKNGWINGSESQGQRYILSTMLAVTGKNGSTLDQALKQIQSSCKADGSHPRGKFFFSKNKDIRSTIRHSQFTFAAKELSQMGFDVEVSNQLFPKNESRILGATLGSPTIDWGKSNSRFVGGAICDNLTSYGAWWAKSGQTKITDYLNAGAAGASGAVYEPYAIPAKFPNANLQVHYARGSTMAEAFYQSVDSPFQLLIVGDPLCCPFGNFPKFSVKGLKNRSVQTEDITLNLTESSGSPPIGSYDFLIDGKFIKSNSRSGQVSISIEGLSEGYHEMRIIAVSNSLLKTTKTKKIEFWVRKSGFKLAIEVNQNKLASDKFLEISASSQTENPIEIRQNARVIGQVRNGEPLKIKASLLGLGRFNVQGYVSLENELIASVPVEIEVKK